MKRECDLLTAFMGLGFYNNFSKNNVCLTSYKIILHKANMQESRTFKGTKHKDYELIRLLLDTLVRKIHF